VLYRFVQVTPERPAIMGADGPWWLESEHFMKLNHFALANGLPVSHVVQSLVSIHAEWPEVNGFVRAEVIQSLKCWKGRGSRSLVLGRKRAVPSWLRRGAGRRSLRSLSPVLEGFLRCFGRPLPLWIVRRSNPYHDDSRRRAFNFPFLLLPTSGCIISLVSHTRSHTQCFSQGRNP
jgi:hypothetical protein